SILFGPALIDAYRLECQVAEFPRVIVSDEAAAVMVTCAATVSDEDVVTDGDGKRILNLFGSGLRNGAANARQMVLGFHQVAVREEIPKVKEARKDIRAKWKYVVEQLNSTAARYNLGQIP